jgi:uncharacterized membrane protein YhaH (DUF805 family)
VPTLLVIFYFILNFFLIIASISLAVRRLHDTGRSHWHLTFVYILFFSALLLGWMVPSFFTGPFVFVGLLGGIYVFVLMFFKSQPGTNKWGDTPEKHFGFIDASKKYFINWLDFKSRSRRSEHWWTLLTNLCITITFFLFEYMMGWG